MGSTCHSLIFSSFSSSIALPPVLALARPPCKSEPHAAEVRRCPGERWWRSPRFDLCVFSVEIHVHSFQTGQTRKACMTMTPEFALLLHTAKQRYFPEIESWLENFVWFSRFFSFLPLFPRIVLLVFVLLVLSFNFNINSRGSHLSWFFKKIYKACGIINIKAALWSKINK